MSAISSLYSRLAAALSGLRNAFFGQTRARARLNVIASYDQSNELFQVRLSPSTCCSLPSPPLHIAPSSRPSRRHSSAKK